MAAHKDHDTSRTPEARTVGVGQPGDPGNLGHGLPPTFATSVPDYSETGVFYEKEDTSPRAVIRVGIILTVATIASVAITLATYMFFARLQNRAEVKPPALWQRAPGALPPEPRLQTTPFGDLEKVQAEERTALATYGWVDKQAGTVRIPIEDAMRLLVERAAPAVPAAGASPAAHGVAPASAAAGVHAPAPAAPSPQPAASPGGGH